MKRIQPCQKHSIYMEFERRFPTQLKRELSWSQQGICFEPAGKFLGRSGNSTFDPCYAMLEPHVSGRFNWSGGCVCRESFSASVLSASDSDLSASARSSTDCGNRFCWPQRSNGLVSVRTLGFLACSQSKRAPLGRTSRAKADDVVALPAEPFAKFARNEASASFARHEAAAAFESFQEQCPKQASRTPRAPDRNQLTQRLLPIVAIEKLL